MLDESAATMIARLIQKRVFSPKAGFGTARTMALPALRTGSGIDIGGTGTARASSRARWPARAHVSAATRRADLSRSIKRFLTCSSK